MATKTHQGHRGQQGKDDQHPRRAPALCGDTAQGTEEHFRHVAQGQKPARHQHCVARHQLFGQQRQANDEQAVQHQAFDKGPNRHTVRALDTAAGAGQRMGPTRQAEGQEHGDQRGQGHKKEDHSRAVFDADQGAQGQGQHRPGSDQCSGAASAASGAAGLGGGHDLGRKVEGCVAQAPAQAQQQQPPETGQGGVAQGTEGRSKGSQHADRAVAAAGVETHHMAVAEDPHQSVGRQQQAGLAQGHAEGFVLHGQQQVEQGVAGQAQAKDRGGAGRSFIGGAGVGIGHGRQTGRSRMVSA